MIHAAVGVPPRNRLRMQRPRALPFLSRELLCKRISRTRATMPTPLAPTALAADGHLEAPYRKYLWLNHCRRVPPFRFDFL